MAATPDASPVASPMAATPAAAPNASPVALPVKKTSSAAQIVSINNTNLTRLRLVADLHSPLRNSCLLVLIVLSRRKKDLAENTFSNSAFYFIQVQQINQR
jgi:hypothetical protein